MALSNVSPDKKWEASMHGHGTATAPSSAGRQLASVLGSIPAAIAIAIAIAAAPAHASPITFDGFQWEPLGQAKLGLTVGGLQVTNIDATGDDGVRLLVPSGVDPANVDTFISGSGLGTSSSPAKAFLQETLRGTINGTSGQPIKSFTATTMSGGGVSLEADMSPISPMSLTAFYYNKGALVLTEPGISAVDGYLAGPAPTPDDWGGGGFTWILAAMVNTSGGHTVSTDDLVVEPIGGAVTFGGPFSIDYTASQVGEFVIVGVAVPESSSAALLSISLLLLWWASRSRSREAA
jgi:hypothetical protein